MNQQSSTEQQTRTRLIEEYVLIAHSDDPRNNPEYADYALLGSDGTPIAIVEAKRSSRDELAGKRQASDYADRIKARFGQDSFIFLTNGQTIQFWDRELDLAARWGNDVNEQLDGGISTLVAKSARDKGLGCHSTADSVRELIQDDIVWKREHLGKEERTMRLAAVLQYPLDQHIPDIIAELA